MALKTFCGFESGVIADEIILTSVGATTPTIQGTVKRTGTKALRCNATTTGTSAVLLRGVNATGLAADLAMNTMYARFYFRYATKPSANAEYIAQVYAGSVGTAGIRIDSNGNLSLWDNAATPVQVGSTGSTVLAANTWYCIEWKVSNSTGGGTWEVKVNGVSECSGTPGTYLSASIIQLVLGKYSNVNGRTVDYYYDDVEVDDAAYPGPGAVWVLNPNGNGNYTAWTGTYTAVDDYVSGGAIDSDTTYINSSTFTQQESQAIEAATGTVFGVPVAVRSHHMVRDVSTTLAFQVGIRSSATDSLATSADGGATYAARSPMFLTNPSGGGAWTISALDSVETLIKHNQNAVRELRCTATYLLVATHGEVWGGTGAATAATSEAAIGARSNMIRVGGSGTAPVSPTVRGSWTSTQFAENVTGQTYDAAGEEKDSPTLSSGSTELQFVVVTPPIKATTFGKGVVFGAWCPWEANATGNVNSQIGVYVVSNDGATLRATLVAKGANGRGAAYTTKDLPHTPRSRKLAFAALSSYTCVDGDRIQIEIGHEAVSGSPKASVIWGNSPESHPDFADSESTSGVLPWLALYGVEGWLWSGAGSATASTAASGTGDVVTGSGTVWTGNGAASAAAAASGAGKLLAAGSGAATAASAAAGAGKLLAVGSGSATAAASATGVGGTRFAAAGAASATAAASGAASLLANGAGAASASAAASGAGSLAAVGSGAATAAGISIGSGALLARGAGAATASAASSGAGLLVNGAAGSATAASAAIGAGSMLSAGAGAAGATGAASGVGGQVFAGTGAATAESVAAGTGDALRINLGSAEATTLASGAGSLLAGGIGAATASSAASGAGALLAAGSGAASAVGSATGVGGACWRGLAAAASIAVAVGVGGLVERGAGQATSEGVATGVGMLVTGNMGAATALSAAQGSGSLLARGAASSTAATAATGAGALRAVGAGAASATAACQALGHAINSNWSTRRAALPTAQARGVAPAGSLRSAEPGARGRGVSPAAAPRAAAAGGRERGVSSS